MSKVSFRNLLDEDSEFEIVDLESEMLLPTLLEYARTKDSEVYDMILNEKVSVYLNGELVPIDDWLVTDACINDEFIIVPDLKGGVLKIAIGAVITVIGMIPGNPFSTYMIAFGVSLMLGGVSQLLFQPDLPVLSDTGSKSTQTYNWTGIKTTARSDLPVPLIYGTHMVGGNAISVFTESLAEENYLYMLIALGEGEIEGICQEYDHTSVCTTSDTTNAAYTNPAIKLNDQPFKSYNDIEWWFRNGTNTQTKIPNFDGARIQYDDGRTITQGDTSSDDGIVYTTTKKVDSVNIQVRAPALFTYVEGKEEEYEIRYRIYWKGISDVDYTLWNPDAYSPTVAVCTTANKPADLAPTIPVARAGITASTYISNMKYVSTISDIIYSIKRPTYILYINSSETISFNLLGGTSYIYYFDYIIYEVTPDGLNELDRSDVLPTPRTSFFSGDFGNYLTFYNNITKVTMEIEDYSFSVSSSIKKDDVFIISSELNTTAGNDIIVNAKSRTGYWSSVSMPLAELGGSVAVPERDTYILKIQRADDPSEAFDTADNLILNSVTEIVDGEFIYPNTALLGFKLKATEQLSGAPPNVTTILKGLKVSVPNLATNITTSSDYLFDDTYWDDTNEKWINANGTEVYWQPDITCQDTINYTSGGANVDKITDTNASTITILQLDDDEEAWSDIDKTASYFDADCEFYTQINCTTNAAAGDTCGLWALTNTIDTLTDIDTASGDFLAIFWKEDSGNDKITLTECNSGSRTSDSSSALSKATEYYLDIKRDESVGTYGTLYCYIYSDITHTILVDTLTVTLTKKVDFRYLFWMTSFNGGVTGCSWSGTIKNFRIITNTSETAWRTEFTDNAILCVNDLMTNTRYGIGDYITSSDIYTSSLKSVMEDCHASYNFYNATYDYTKWWDNDAALDDTWADNWQANFIEQDIVASYNTTNREVEFVSSDIDGESRTVNMSVDLDSTLNRGGSYTFSIEFGKIATTIKQIMILSTNSDTPEKAVLGSIDNKSAAGTYTTTLKPKFGGVSQLILIITCFNDMDIQIDDISVTINTTDHTHTWDGVLDGKQAAPTAMKEMCDSFRTWISWYNGKFNFILDKDSTIDQTISMGDTYEFTESFTPLSEIPFRLIGQYTDEEFNFNMSQIVAKSTDTSLNKSSERTIGLKGITNRKRAERELKYKSRVVSTNTQTINVRCGQDILHKTAGDLINISDSLPQWGHSGRIIDYNHASKKIIIEDSYNFTSTDSGATVQLIKYAATQNNTVTATLNVTATGSQQTLFVKTWEGTPADYAMFALGNEDTYVKPFRLVMVNRVDKNDVEFSALEHNSGVYRHSDDSITIDKTQYSSLPNPMSAPSKPIITVNLLPSSEGIGFQIHAEKASADNVTKEVIIQLNELSDGEDDDGFYETITRIPEGSTTVKYIDNNLKLDTTYLIRAYCRSTYRNGAGSYSEITFTKENYAPEPPTGVYIKGADPNDVDSSSRHRYDGKDITIAWNPVSVNYNQQLTIRGYNVEIYKDSITSANLGETYTNIMNPEFYLSYERNKDIFDTTVPQNNIIFRITTMNDIAESITSTDFYTTNVVPSTPTGLTAVAIEDGVTFNWVPNTETDVLKYEYRTQVESGGWSSWEETFGSYITRRLTPAELVAQAGGRSNVQIEVKAVDVYNQESTTAATTNEDCINDKSYFTVSPTLGVGHFQFIQEALNSIPDGSTILLKAGTYDLSLETGITNYSGGVVVPDKNLTIIGDSRDGVIIQNNSEDHGFILHNLTKTISMSLFTIDAQDTGTSARMIYIYGDAESDNTTNITIDSVRMDINYYGILAYRGEDGGLTINNCEFHHDTAYGQTIHSYKNVNYTNNLHFDSIGRVYIAHCDNVVATSNIFTEGGNDAFQIEYCTNLVTSSNTVHSSNSFRGFSIGLSCDNVICANNTIELLSTSNNEITGMYINGATRVILSSNNIKLNITSTELTWGIKANNISSGLAVLNNSIYVDNDDTTENHYGLYLSNVDNTNFSSNTIDMVNSDAKDIAIYINANSDNNNIDGLILTNFGTSITNLGSGNTIKNVNENGVNQTEDSGVIYNESLLY